MRKRREELIRVSQDIELTDPVLVAAWPGIANVAMTAITYLADKLKAEEFAKLDALQFFDLNGAMIENNVIQLPKLPESKFYYWKRNGAGSDIILFIGEAQPTMKSFELANRILDFARSYGVKRVYTIAAAMVPQFHEQPRVWGTATNPFLVKELHEYGLDLKGNFYVAGMNGLLLSVAKSKRMEGTCLLGETPKYLSELDNPIASQAVLAVLANILHIEIDMSELQETARQASTEIKEALQESRRQYIDHFTVPLWERPQEEDKG